MVSLGSLFHAELVFLHLLAVGEGNAIPAQAIKLMQINGVFVGGSRRVHALQGLVVAVAQEVGR